MLTLTLDRRIASSQAAAQAAASAAAEQQAQQQAQQQAKQSSGGQTYSGGAATLSSDRRSSWRCADLPVRGILLVGYATYYTQNGVAGNCGNVNPDSAWIVALPTATYAGGSNCGKQVTITRVSTGKTIQATVADSCPTCESRLLAPVPIDTSSSAVQIPCA